MNFKKLLVPLIACSVLFITGCKPDTLDVTVYSSDVEKSIASDKVHMAQMTVVFSMLSDDEDGMLGRARDAAAKYLPEDANIKLIDVPMGKGIQVSMQIPVGTQKAIDELFKENPKYPMVVGIVENEFNHNGHELILVSTSVLDKINEEVSKLNSMIDVDLPAGETTIHLVGESPGDSLRALAWSVLVGTEPFLMYDAPVEHRKSHSIVFSGADGSMYANNKYNPKVIIYNEIPEE